MALPNPPFNVKTFRGAQFSRRLFLDLIATQGHQVQIAGAAQCVCRQNTLNDRERVDCPVCAGEGWDYPSGMTATTRAIISNADSDKHLQARAGGFLEGDVRITVLGELVVPIHSRVTMLEAHHPIQLVRTRAASGVDTMRHPIVIPTNLRTGPGAATVATTGVLHVRAMMAATETAGSVMVEGTHFTVTAGGAIDWSIGDALGTAPVAGTGRYTIVYYARPRYIVTDTPHVFRAAQVKLKQATQTREIFPVYFFAKLDNALATPTGP